VNPSEHPELATFLEHVVAFDSVDDESALEGEGSKGRRRDRRVHVMMGLGCPCCSWWL
jgi:hypothetical protein